MKQPYAEMFHSPPGSPSITPDLLAWITLSTVTDDAAIKAVRMARAKAKLSHIAPYRAALANLTTASNACAARLPGMQIWQGTSAKKEMKNERQRTA